MDNKSLVVEVGLRILVLLLVLGLMYHSEFEALAVAVVVVSVGQTVADYQEILKFRNHEIGSGDFAWVPLGPEEEGHTYVVVDTGMEEEGEEEEKYYFAVGFGIADRDASLKEL